MTHIWRPHWKHERVSTERCRAAVADGGRSVGFHQCCRKPVVFVDGIGFCKEHSPEAEEKRQREVRERVDAEIAEMERRNTRTYARHDIVRLIGELRDGGWVLTEELRTQLEDALRKATGEGA